MSEHKYFKHWFEDSNIDTSHEFFNVLSKADFQEIKLMFLECWYAGQKSVIEMIKDEKEL